MTEDIVVALLSTLGVIVGAVLAVMGTGFGMLWKRIVDLEARLGQLDGNLARLRSWAYDVKDKYYRHRVAGAPDLPPMPDDEEEE